MDIMGRKLRLKTKTLSLLLALFSYSVTAQGITGPDRFSPGAIFGSIIRFDGGTMVILADIATFLLVWFGFYAILATAVKLGAERAGGNVGDTIKTVLLGDSSTSVGSRNPKKNWLFWLSLLAVVSLGPYLFPYIHGFQSALVGGASILYIIFIIAGLLLLGFLLLNVLGYGGQGLLRGSEPVADAASSAANSRGADAIKDGAGKAYEKASEGANWLKGAMGRNKHIQEADEKLKDLLAALGQQKVCGSCGTQNPVNEDNCSNCSSSI